MFLGSTNNTFFLCVDTVRASGLAKDYFDDQIKDVELGDIIPVIAMPQTNQDLKTATSKFLRKRK